VQERADGQREELTAGPVELIRLTELGTRGGTAAAAGGRPERAAGR
jgi:hypothetical protein